MWSMRNIWVGVLVLGVLLILGSGSVPAKAAGMDRSPPYGSDYLTFAEELRTSGALKFYDETEDMLRAGKFSRAFTRYLFLRANIRGQSLYTGLSASVDQRLQFLREQMHLGEGALQYEYRETYAKRRRRPKPACPPPAPKTAKAKKPAPEEKPPEMIIPAPPPEEKGTPPPKAGTTPPGAETKPPGTESQPPAEGAQKPAPAPSTTPAPSPGLWEKLKRRLKFW
jgi:hypothetical protein